MHILGVDPGSRTTGYGLIEVQGQRLVHLASGCIHTQGQDFPERLRIIFEGLTAIIDSHHPGELAIERVFMHRNADSALKLGQARGVAMLAGVVRGLQVFEYSPNEIKKATVGRGHAAKAQVQHMIRVLLNLPEIPEENSADALAVAICHSNTRDGLARYSQVAGQAR